MKHVTVYSSLCPVSLLPVCDMAPGVPKDTDEDADIAVNVVNGMACDAMGLNACEWSECEGSKGTI